MTQIFNDIRHGNQILEPSKQPKTHDEKQLFLIL